MADYKMEVYNEPPEEAEVAFGRIMIPVRLPVELMDRMEITTFFNPVTYTC